MKSHYTIHLHGSARPLRAIAFDLDSTLTKPYLDFTKLRRQLQIPEGDILAWLAQLPPSEQARAHSIIDAFEQDGVENAEWNDGAQETLHAVRDMGFPTAIVTRNSRTSLVAVCRHLDIDVDVLVSRDDASPKPDPACLHYAAERLGVATEHLLMVGDYRHDTDAGRAAGALTALLTNGRIPTWPVEADVVIERLDELLFHIHDAHSR